MPSPTTIDLKSLLQPIPGDSPAGRSLRFSTELDEMIRASKEDDPAMRKYLLKQGDKPKTADWKLVLKLGTDMLKEKSKDLEVATRVAEALGKLYGVAGLCDGLRLMRGVHVIYWKSYFPKFDPANLNPRKRPFALLDNALPAALRAAAVTAGAGPQVFSLDRISDARRAEESGEAADDAAADAAGDHKTLTLDEAVARTPRKFYEELKQDLDGLSTALRKLEQTNAAPKTGRKRPRRLSADPPRFVNLRKAVEEMRLLVEPLLEEKRAADPTYVPPDAPIIDDEADDQTPEGGDDGGDEPEADEPPEAPPERPRALAKARPPKAGKGGPIADVDDALERIREAAAYLRRNAPESPVGYLAGRSVRAGVLYGLDEPSALSGCRPPSGDSRETLVRLHDESDWDQLLDQAEQAITRDDGAAWLDADHFADLALRSGDADRSAVVKATRAALRALLDEFPGWPTSKFQRDRTAAASEETRDWLRSEILPEPAEETGGPPAASGDQSSETAPGTGRPPAWPEPLPDAEGDDGVASPSAEPPPWVTARELAERGESGRAVQVLLKALNGAVTGRGRFLIKLQLAEQFVAQGKPRLALPLAEDLARQVDEFRLEQWEDGQLAARVWAALYSSITRSGGASGPNGARLEDIFSRLCRLDLNRAMNLAPEPH